MLKQVKDLASALRIQPLTARVSCRARPDRRRNREAVSRAPAGTPAFAGIAHRHAAGSATSHAAAIAAHEKILIYGDYDVDGTRSVVILKKAIELAGGEASYHVPHRLKDGYGMRAEVIERAAAMGVRLIISVDTGIRAQRSGAGRAGAGHRCDCHRSSPAGSGAAAGAGGSESEPAAIAIIPTKIFAARAWRSSWCTRCLPRSAGRKRNWRAC